MKYFQMDGTIDEAMLTRFMDFCNSYPSEKCTIVINSGGGMGCTSTMILNIINSNRKRFTLVSAGVYSAAFCIFYHAKCEKKIIYGSVGMHHKEYLKNIIIGMKGKVIYSDDKNSIKNIKLIDDSFSHEFLTKKELKTYNKSYDVYFTFKRMTEIFPNAEIIK